MKKSSNLNFSKTAIGNSLLTALLCAACFFFSAFTAPVHPPTVLMTLETFETESTGTAFSEGGINFTSSGDLSVVNFVNFGAGSSDFYLDSDFGNSTNGRSVGSIVIQNAATSFTVTSFAAWTSDNQNFAAASVTFIGTLAGGGTATEDVTITPTTNDGTGYDTGITFVGALSGAALTALEIDLPAGLDYIAIDDFEFTTAPVVSNQYSIDDVSHLEGNGAGTVNYQFTITRTVTTNAGSVQVQSADNSATAGSDYTAFPLTTVNFTAGGGATQTVNVTVQSDNTIEPNETYFMNLTNPVGGTIADAQGIGTILDDDQICETYEDETDGDQDFAESGFNFTVTSDLEIEEAIGFGAGGSDFWLGTVAGNGGSSGSVGLIQIATVGSSFNVAQLDAWTSNDDGNNPTAGMVTFTGSLVAGGTVTHTAMVTPAGFSYFTVDFTGTPLDGAQLLSLEITLPAGLDYIAIDNFKFGTATVTSAQVSVSDVSAIEGTGGGTVDFDFTVTRTNNATAFTVDIASSDISATAGADYTAVASTTLNFMMGGALTKTVTVSVASDGDPEPNETFQMTLSNVSAGAVILDGIGIGTILDDDTICETYEDETDGTAAFTENAINFSSSGDLKVENTPNFGSGLSDFVLSTVAGNGGSALGSVGKITITTADTGFEIFQIDAWTSNDDGTTALAGDITFTGTLAAGGTVTTTVNVAPPGNTGNDYINISFTGTPLENQTLTELDIILVGAGLNFIALDNFCFEAISLCNFPTITNVAAVPSSICDGGSSTLTVTGTLNDATSWQWYTASCGGTSAGSGTSINVSPTTTTQYFVRGEGGCAGTTQSCSTVTVTVVADPSISASGATTICTGGNADLSSSTSGGAGTCTFQWQVSSTSAVTGFANIGGATSSTFNTGALTATRWYRIIRSCTGNGCGDATSTAVEVTVAADPSISITGGVTICPMMGGSATLTATPAGGTGTCTVQWQMSPAGMNTWTNTGAGANTLMVAPAVDTDYRAVYSCTGGDCDAATSNTETVNILCCELVVTCPSMSLGTIDCDDPIPTAANNEATFEALGMLADIEDNPGFCGTLNITANDVFTPTVNICNGRTMQRTYTISDDITTLTCVQNLTINPPAIPTITCPANPQIEWAAGFNINPVGANTPQDPSISPAVYGMPTTTVSCTMGTVTYQDVLTGPTPGNCPNLWEVVRTWTVTDGCNQMASCQQTFTITDTTAPVISACPPTRTVEGCTTADILNGGLTALPFSAAPAAITESQFVAENGAASDNCGSVSYSYVDVASGTCPTVVTRVFTVTDICGLTNTCTQIINIDDTTNPVVACQNISVPLTANGNVTITPAQVFDAANSSDNCNGTVTPVAVSPNTFSCLNEGANTVTLAGEDPCGNQGTCTAIVTIEEYITNVSATATPESCAGADDGTITVSATAPAGQVGYSVDGGVNFQFTGVFNNRPAGTYNVVIKVFGIPEVCEATTTATVVAGAALTTWYKDLDNDGYSDGVTLSDCTQPAGYKAAGDLTALNGDCDDNEASVNPGAPEICDGLDNNCDGVVPANEIDADGDGFRLCDGDCDDSDASVNPGATEICNGIDDNCNGMTDEGTSGGLTFTGNVAFYTQAALDAWSPCYSIINGNVVIAGASIIDLSPLDNIVEITGSLTIQSTGLASMSGFDILANIGGNVTILFNSSLTTMNGLGLLETVGGSFYLYYNFLLSDCCAIHDLVNGGISGAVFIFFNKTGCNSVAEINTSCAPVLLVSAPQNNTVEATSSPLLIETKNQSGELQVDIFPNPVSSVLNVNVSGKYLNGTIQLTDITGRIVLVKKLMSGQQRYQLNVGQLINGFYLATVRFDNTTVTKKLVVN